MSELIDQIPTEPEDCWYTGEDVLQSIAEFFGTGFSDPCPANPTFDGLTGNWGKDCYINPPYSKKLKRAFINKAKEQYEVGDRYLWMFNYANSVDLWDVHLRSSAVLIPEKRFHFLPGHSSLVGHPDNPDPEKRKPGSPRYDNIMILWGNPTGFKDAFKKWGKVYDVGQ